MPALPTIPLAAHKPAAEETGASHFTRPPTTQALPTALPKPAAPAARLPSFAKPPGATPLPSMGPKTPTPGVMPFALPKTPALPTAAPAHAPAPAAAEQEFLVVEISAMMEGWPGPVREEIGRLQMGGAAVSLPMAKLDSALKTGRVVFTWAELRQWLQPPPPEGASAHGETALDLPLSVIAPRFMARRRPGAGQKQVTIAAQIPDLFASMAKRPETAAAAPVAEAATPAPVAAMPAPTVVAPAPVAPTVAAVAAAAAAAGGLGEIFGEPGKSEWSPQEITRKICALDGVAGSVMAMSDGLLMAGQLPAPMRAETVAAFMPQIVGRVSQYAGEMQLGPVKGVVVEAGRGRCAMHKAGKLYLAVVGRAGEALPEEIIGRIAAEIAKRNP
jgi:predicted regulator of Ras-like GTPase activity (Roadblock/LC7/MglB family)